MRTQILLLGLMGICLSNLFSQNSSKYEIEINKDLYKTEPIIANKYLDEKHLNDGNLYIHFQSEFENDYTVIRINEILFGEYPLTTEWSTELADIIVIPNSHTIMTVGISINDGKEAVFEVEKINQVVVRLRNNKLLIGFRRHVPYYD
jgi:hypothetical protein